MGLHWKLWAAAILMAGVAEAAPTCTTTTDVGASGVVAWSSLGAGDCIRSADKLYGNFVSANIPADTVLIFNTNTIGSLVHQQLSFDGSYLAGTTYTWSYEMAIDFSVATPGTVITSIDADFTQTASNAPSTLDKALDPAGDAAIHEVKDGAVLQDGSVTTANFGPDVTSIAISETLVDNGTISSVTNTITEFAPGQNIPEPLTLALMGFGLAGLKLARRRRA